MSAPSASLAALRQHAGDNHLPLHASFEVTHNCNLRCTHCYLTGHLGVTEGQLTFTEIISVLDQLAKMQTLFLQLTGGEFFSRPDAFAILDAASARGFVITLFTNGLLVDAAYAKRLAAAEVYQVHVSILGNEQSHDEIAARRGAYQKALAAMDFLRAEGVSVLAKIILTRKSAPHYEEIKKTCQEHADDLVVSVDLLPTIDGVPAAAELLLSAADLAALPKDTHEEVFCQPEELDPQGSVCNAGRNLITIDPFGEVYPCISYRRSVGNIREHSLRDLWQGNTMRKIAGLTQGDRVSCQSCGEKISCNYCPGRAWQEMGDPGRAASDLCARTERLNEAFRVKPPPGTDNDGLISVHSLLTR